MVEKEDDTQNFYRVLHRLEHFFGIQTGLKFEDFSHSQALKVGSGSPGCLESWLGA